MSISKFCIKHKVTTLLAVIMISIFGVVFTTRLQMSLLPDMEAPMAVVICYYNGKKYIKIPYKISYIFKALILIP